MLTRRTFLKGLVATPIILALPVMAKPALVAEYGQMRDITFVDRNRDLLRSLVAASKDRIAHRALMEQRWQSDYIVFVHPDYEADIRALGKPRSALSLMPGTLLLETVAYGGVRCA